MKKIKTVNLQDKKNEKLKKNIIAVEKVLNDLLLEEKLKKPPKGNHVC